MGSFPASTGRPLRQLWPLASLNPARALDQQYTITLTIAQGQIIHEK